MDQDKDMSEIQETEKDIICPPQMTEYTPCKSPNLRQKEKIFLLTFTRISFLGFMWTLTVEKIQLQLLYGRKQWQNTLNCDFSPKYNLKINKITSFNSMPGSVHCMDLYPVSYTMGTGSFQEVKRLGHGFDYSSPLQAWTDPEGSRRLRLPDFKTVST